MKILKSLYWGIYGSTIKNPEIPSNPRSFLFVCQGNICRGPFAAGLAENLLGKQAHFCCGSAGTHVMVQTPSPSEAVLAAKEFGVDLQHHLSRHIELGMVESFDMILAMEARQYRYLKNTFSRFQEKIFLLPLFETDLSYGSDRIHLFNIEDPYDKPLDVFLNCYKRIKICLEGLFGQVRT